MRGWWRVATTAAVGLLGVVALRALPSRAYEPASGTIPTSGRVKSVYDGDTLTLVTGEKVRLKWANTPEMRPVEPYAVDARDFASRLVLDREVTLTVDAHAPRDGYGRILASVAVEGQDLSLALLAEGYAHVYLIPPVDGDPAPYIAAQEAARAANKGIWSTDRFRGPLHITSFHANGRGDENIDPNLEYLRVANLTAGPFDLGGYRIADAQGNAWPLPAMVVPAGHTVRIHSGRGKDDADPAAQLTVHLGSDTPVWSNSYDKAVILAPDGTVVDAVEYHGKGD